MGEQDGDENGETKIERDENLVLVLDPVIREIT